MSAAAIKTQTLGDAHLNRLSAGICRSSASVLFSGAPAQALTIVDNSSYFTGEAKMCGSMTLAA
jgi:hypothetical protein